MQRAGDVVVKSVVDATNKVMRSGATPNGSSRPTPDYGGTCAASDAYGAGYPTSSIMPGSIGGGGSSYPSNAYYGAGGEAAGAAAGQMGGTPAPYGGGRDGAAEGGPVSSAPPPSYYPAIPPWNPLV